MEITTEKAIKNLTLGQLQEIVEVIENKGYITDECRLLDGTALLSKPMISKGGPLLIERLRQETEYLYEVDYTSEFDGGYGEVAGLYSLDWFEDDSDFKKKVLLPFIKKAKKNLP
ncbi:hypothetical protein [Bacillus cereus]